MMLRPAFPIQNLRGTRPYYITDWVSENADTSQKSVAAELKIAKTADSLPKWRCGWTKNRENCRTPAKKASFVSNFVTEFGGPHRASQWEYIEQNKNNHSLSRLLVRMGHDRREAACASPELKLCGFAKVVCRSKADSSLIHLFNSTVRNGYTS
jgi:hypothetical protein